MSGILVGPAYRDPDDEFEYWLSQKGKKMSDQTLDIKAVHQILNGEIDFYEVKGRGLSRRGKDYEEGWLAALKEFRTVLIRAEYASKNTLPKEPGYMGDIGGTPYGPSDR